MKAIRNILIILLVGLHIPTLFAQTTVSAEQLCQLGHNAIISERFDQALHYYEQAQQTYLSIYDSVAPEIALTESFIGYAYYRQGKLTEAQQRYAKALKILAHTPGGRNHPLFFNIMNNLATVQLDLGNYHSALSHYNRLHRLTASDTTSLFHFTIQANMATAHYLLHHHNTADSVWLQLLHTLDKEDESFTELYRHVACNLAHSALEQLNYERADSCVLLASSTFSSDQKHTLAYSYVLDLQAFIEQQLGQYAMAEKDMKQVVHIRQKIVGEDNADYIMALNNLANVYAIQNKYKQANSIYSQEFEARSHHVAANLLSMSERQRLLYVEKMDLVFETYLSYAFRSYQDNSAAVALAYDDLLFYKGLLLNTANVVQDIITHTTDTTMVHVYQQILQTKRYLMDPSTQLSNQERRRYVFHIDSLEGLLNQYCKHYAQLNQLMRVDHKDIQQKLSSRSVAIEFADSPLPDGDRQYMAMILYHDSLSPTLVPLCKNSDLSFVNEHNAANRIYNYELEGAHLSQLVWKPLASHLSGIDTIYYALSGILHLVNLEAIPTTINRYVSDDHVLIQTSSTRYLISDPTTTEISNAVVFGGIRYNDSAYIEIKTKLLPFLHNTLQSTFQLQSILNAGGMETTVYTEYAAKKDSLCALSGTPIHILHIATHGFYIPNDSTQVMSPMRRRLVRCSQIPGLGISDNMKRSGLLMAGASMVTADSTMDAFSRTVLTARDVSMLNLSTLDIVVLSACETAKGDVSSDGIFGLQRAFKQAGVRTIMMTLWEVNDVVTRDMMLTFYQYWMQSKSKRDAFHRAVNDIRHRYPEPEYWAAYVMLD